MSLKIIGSGLAGLLAANMLSRHNPRVFEAQSELPQNHSALLRFRTPVVGDVLGIPFQKVIMTKGYVPWMNPVADSLAYARKCTGIARSDRSIVSSGIETHTRFIAPEDLVARMAESLRAGITFDHYFDFHRNGAQVISTIPMPWLMKILNYPAPIEFKQVHGFNLIARLNDIEAYASLYVPSPQHQFNRISLTSDRMIAEYSSPGRTPAEVEVEMQAKDAMTEAMKVAALFGLVPQEESEFFKSEPAFKMQRFSKVVPVDDGERRRFIAWATDKHGIFSLGRFATWRPSLLLDDAVKDIRLIDGWLQKGGEYTMKLHRVDRKSVV